VGFTIRARPSQSQYIETVWYTQSPFDTSYIAPAQGHLEMIITRRLKNSSLTLWGPSRNAMSVTCPKEAEFVGIRFSLGTYIPSLLTSELVNVHVNLPTATRGDIHLNGYIWHLPDYDDVEMFVARLVKRGIVTRDPLIDTVLQGCPTDLSIRSVQRRFRSIIGVSQRTLYQVERAQHAQELLQQGVSILDTVSQAGYFDQPHLTRSLKRLIGRTPAEILHTSSTS